MARVPQYVQDQLASSRVGTPGVDNSGMMLAQSGLRTTGIAAATSLGATSDALGMERQAMAYSADAQTRYQNAVGEAAQTAFVGLKALAGSAKKQQKDYQDDIAIAKAQYHAKTLVRDRMESIQNKYKGVGGDAVVDSFRQDIEPAIDAAAESYGFKEKGYEKVYAEFTQAALGKAAEVEPTLSSWALSEGNTRSQYDLAEIAEVNRNKAGEYGKTGDWNRFNEMMNDFAGTKDKWFNAHGAAGFKLWNKEREDAVKQYINGRMGTADGIVGTGMNIQDDLVKSNTIAAEVKGMLDSGVFPWLDANEVKSMRNEVQALQASNETKWKEAKSANAQVWRNANYNITVDAYMSQDADYVDGSLRQLDKVYKDYIKDLGGKDNFDEDEVKTLVSDIGKLRTHATALRSEKNRLAALTEAQRKDEEEKAAKAAAELLASPAAENARINARKTFDAVQTEAILRNPKRTTDELTSDMAQINTALRTLSKLRADGLDGPKGKPNPDLENQVAQLKASSQIVTTRLRESYKRGKLPKEDADDRSWFELGMDDITRNAVQTVQRMQRVNAPAPKVYSGPDGKTINFRQDLTKGNPVAAGILDQRFRELRNASLANHPKRKAGQQLEAIDYANVDAQIMGQMYASKAFRDRLNKVIKDSAPKAKPKIATAAKAAPEKRMVPPPPPEAVKPAVLQTIERLMQQGQGGT